MLSAWITASGWPSALDAEEGDDWAHPMAALIDGLRRVALGLPGAV